jgi:hypothetical protein
MGASPTRHGRPNQSRQSFLSNEKRPGSFAWKTAPIFLSPCTATLGAFFPVADADSAPVAAITPFDVPPPKWVPVTTALIDRPCVKTNLTANGADHYWRIAGHLLSIAVSKFRASSGVEAHRNQALNHRSPVALRGIHPLSREASPEYGHCPSGWRTVPWVFPRGATDARYGHRRRPWKKVLASEFQ